MKVKDSAMGAWFKRAFDNEDDAAVYVLKGLMNTRDGVFWDIVGFYDLKGTDGLDLAYKVLNHLMEFEMDPDLRQDPDGFDHIPRLTEGEINDLAKREGQE